MAKKDEAFELFSQGKAPDSPEVLALGLKKDSVQKYHRLWKEGVVQEVKALWEETPVEEVTAPVPIVKAPIPVGVAVSSLTIGARFEYKGVLYQKRDSTLTTISGLDLKKTQSTQQMTWKGFPSNTLVVPK